EVDPMRFRKKPVEVEAIQYRRDDVAQCAAIHEFLDYTEHEPEAGVCGVSPICIDTLEGQMELSPGDWVIKGVAGEFYPCKPDIFAATYEPVDEPPAKEPEPSGSDFGWWM